MWHSGNYSANIAFKTLYRDEFHCKMLDQSFSAENFRRILDISNRKGLHVEDKLSMSKIRKFNEDIKRVNKLIRENRKLDDKDTLDCLYQIKKTFRDAEEKYPDEKTPELSSQNLLTKHDKDTLNYLYQIKETLRYWKEIYLTNELELISQEVSGRNFKIELNKIDIPDGKALYTVEKSARNFFAIKQIQHNIARLFGIKQADRHLIVGQVIALLGDQFPKYVIRTDIKEFYESISHKPLLRRIDKDNLLSVTSRNILRGLLNSYNAKSGLDEDNPRGVPRGVGVSAYLAELYLRDLDEDIKNLEDVTYYARYVDDIIIIFTPSPTNDPNRDYRKKVESIFCKYQIELNSQKTGEIDLFSKGEKRQKKRLNYLGYHFVKCKSKVKTELTHSKLQKYRKRIDLAFDHYINLSRVNEKLARRLLVKRIRFLTGNTRLKSNKENILIGIYYSNSHLTETNQLKGLDQYLSAQICRRIVSSRLKDRLKKYSFKEGHENKRFSPFRTDELSDIMKIWKRQIYVEKKKGNT